LEPPPLAKDKRQI